MTSWMKRAQNRASSPVGNKMGKKDMKMRIESLKGLLKMGLVCVVVATASQAWASFSLGDAANYAVIFQGGGGNRLNINNGAGLNHSAVDRSEAGPDGR